MSIFSKGDGLAGKKSGRNGIPKRALADAVCEIRINKVQALLSVMGFVAAFAVIMAMLFANNSITVSEGYKKNPLGGNTVVLRLNNRDSVSIDDLERFADRSGAIADVVPTEMVEGVEMYGNQGDSLTYSALATNQEFFKSGGVNVTAGKAFTASDVETRNRVALISGDIAEPLYGSANPVGQDLKVNNQVFRVVGVFEGKGGYEPKELVVLPYRSARLVMNSTNSGTYTFLCGGSAEDAYRAAEEFVSRTLSGSEYALEAGKDGGADLASIIIFIILLLISGLAMCMFLMFPSKRRRESPEVSRTKHRLLYAIVKKEAECVALAAAGAAAGLLLGWLGGMVCLIIGGIPLVFEPEMFFAALLLFIISIGFALLTGIIPSIREKKLIRHDMTR